MPHVVWTRIIIKIGVLNCVMLPKPTSVPQWGDEADNTGQKDIYLKTKPHFTHETAKATWKSAFVGQAQQGNWITGSGQAHTIQEKLEMRKMINSRKKDCIIIIIIKRKQAFEIKYKIWEWFVTINLNPISLFSYIWQSISYLTGWIYRICQAEIPEWLIVMLSAHNMNVWRNQSTWDTSPPLTIRVKY